MGPLCPIISKTLTYLSQYLNGEMMKKFNIRYSAREKMTAKVEDFIRVVRTIFPTFCGFLQP